MATKSLSNAMPKSMAQSMLKPWVFCSRCRGLEVGWNRRYLRHSLTCLGGLSRSARHLALMLAAALVVFMFPLRSSAPVIAEWHSPAPEAPGSAGVAGGVGLAEAEETDPLLDPTIAAVDDILARHTLVSATQRLRIARAVVTSARRHDVDPFLVTGILIAESSGNAHAISNRQAVGIMQIHVPTWGAETEAEGLNLFLLEDNIDFGTRIIRDYTRTYGLWEGVMRYLGASEPTDEAMAYVRRVQGIYSDRQAD
jgi:Transglycosylase SLT domain